MVFAAAGLWVAAVAARAQGAKKPYRIGVLSVDPDELLQQSLRELGYVEARDIVLEIKDTQGKPERSDEMALDLVRLKVDVIVATHPAAVFSAKRATTTIPIVMVNTPDPVELGLVASLARPGGNITGLTTLTVDVSIKQLQLLQAVLPRASRVALLWNPDNPWHPVVVKELRSGRGSQGLQLQFLEVRGPDALETAFEAMTTNRADAVMVLADPMLFTHRRRLVDLAAQNRLPMMGNVRGTVEAGSLMSFWADRTDLSRRTASYIDRILKGAKPSDLPIEVPTRFEFVINLKTAKALGITIPQSALLRADAVIQ